MRSAVWWEEEALHWIDQTALPDREVIVVPTSLEEVVDAIKALQVRGAPAIGIAGAYGLVLALTPPPPDPEAALRRVLEAAERLKATRPTAVNLAAAVDAGIALVTSAPRERPATWAEALRAWVRDLVEDDRLACERIGRFGQPLLARARAVLTHCNAGALGTAGWGTATAPLYAWLEDGLRLPVFVDETRPLLQGARLTAWELARAGLPVTVIPDGAAAAVMARGLVDAVIVGADRIARNGDVANKIGTYGLALAASAHHIPFYVAAPRSTFDPSMPDGAAIPIEERDPEEVRTFRGVRVAPPGVAVRNWAFDVTPAEYVTAFITDRGVIRPPYAETLRTAWD